MKRIAIVVLACAAVGCSDPMATSGDRLTQEEAMAVATHVAQAGSTAFAVGLESSPGADAATSVPRTVSADHQVSQPCPVSGTVVLSMRTTMQVDDESQSFVLDTDGSLAHAACAFPHGDLTFTLDGDPDIDFALHAAGTSIEFQPIVSEMGGGFEWSASDGRSGRCGIGFETVTNFVERKRTVRGRICDFEIDQSIRWDSAG